VDDIKQVPASNFSERFSPSPDQSLAEKLTDTIDYLMDDTSYLPLDAVRQNVRWVAESRGHRLVAKESNDSSPAILTLIGTIGVDNCFLSPDGAYKGKTDFTPSLADIKLSCVCRRPATPNWPTTFLRRC
jgi:hypothetical protein